MRYKSLDFKNKAVTYFLYAFSVSLPLHQKLSTIILVAWFITSIVLIKPSKLNKSKFLLLLPALYFTYIVSLIYTDNFSFKHFEQKASFLIFPILFSINYYKYNFKIVNKALFFFVLGCFISVIYCYAHAVFSSITISDGSFLFNSRVDPNLDFLESSIKGGNYFYGLHFSILHHATYFAMFLCFAISILLFKTDLFKSKILSVLGVILFSIAIFQLSSRAGILVWFIVMTYYLFKKYNKRRFIIFSSISLLIVIPLLFLTNPRIKEMTNNLIEKGITFHNEDINSSSLRLMTWNASVEIIKDNPIIGVGIGDAYNELREVYRKKRYVTPYRDKLNAHNQYLQLLVECGLLAFIIYIIQLSFLFKKFKLDKILHSLIPLFLIIITVNSLFESIFNHYSGIVFYAFLFCLLTMSNNKLTELN